MFFIGGITQGTKELIYNAAAMICGRCGRKTLPLFQRGMMPRPGMCR